MVITEADYGALSSDEDLEMEDAEGLSPHKIMQQTATMSLRKLPVTMGLLRTQTPDRSKHCPIMIAACM